MDELIDPESTYLICLVLMLSFNLMFNNETIRSFKTHCIRRTRKSVSAIMYELGKKSKNYYRMSDVSFWKLHKMLKDDIDKKPDNVSRRSRKKRKLSYVPNGSTCSSVRLSIALRFFAGGCPLDIALVHGVSPSEVLFSTWKVADAVHANPLLNIQFPECHKNNGI